jgi:hypothetical protein
MMPVDYALSHQYREERLREAIGYRLAQQAVAPRRSHVALDLHVRVARELRGWLSGVLGFARAEPQHT